ncbi:MAG: type II toxin-antitoxin system HicB family antitoxin [Bryobacterales bacterium]|nr:type II toxin-antitoxin system HicB family antitoxin [Bryobacterales bacterium]
MRYAVIYERTATGYSAYVPDLPGCVAAGETLEQTEALMRGAIELHLAGMVEDGESVPAQGFQTLESVELCVEDSS